MKRFIFFVIISLLSISIFAEDMKIGLVLSGGGARGLSHVGVLKKLEEYNIRPDYISGTSMGAIVGGLYAIGYTAEQLERIFINEDWVELFTDEISRNNISIEEKDDFNRYISEFPIIGNRINLPTGLISGQKLTMRLSRLAAPALSIDDFSDFYIPFRCIATDIESGDAVVLHKGYLPDALRASASIPSIFTPTTIDNHLLIDGGVSRNMPVEDVLEMGANYVIAVDVGSELLEKEHLNSFLKIMQQSLNFRGIERSKESRKKADLLISPKLNDFGITDFLKVKELIKIGADATEKKSEILKEIAERHKPSDERFKPVLNIESLHINKIKFQGLKTVSKNLVIGKFGIEEDSWISYDDLEKGIQRLYGSNYFSKITYQFENNSKGVNLIIRVKEATRRIFRFALYYDKYFNSSINLNSVARNIFFEGTKLSLKGKISESPAVKLSYFVHTGLKPGFGFKPYISYNNYKVPVYNKNILESQFNHHETKVGFIFQTVYFHALTFGLDISHERSHTKSLLNTEEVSFDIKKNRYSLFLKYDTIDNIYFPSEGSRISFDYSSYQNVRTKDQDEDDFPTDFVEFQRFIGHCENYIKLSDSFTWFQIYKIGFINNGLDEIPPSSYAFVGGNNEYQDEFFPFMGLDFMKKNAQNVQTLRIGTQYNIFQNIFCSGEYNLGETSNTIKRFFDFEDYFHSYGLTLGALTPIGPIKFTFSQFLNDYETEIFVNIGFPF